MLDAILLVLVAIIYISYMTSVVRIRTKHRDKFTELKSASSPFVGSIKQMSQIFELIVKRKLSELNDPLLTLTSYICFISVITFVPLMIAYALR